MPAALAQGNGPMTPGAPGAGMHTGMAVLAIALLLLAMLGGIALARFFRQPVDVSRLGAVAAPVAPDADASTQADELDSFVIIPDISGYTQFMRLNRFAAAHAQFVVSRLLETMLTAADPPLTATRVAGDSVMFHAVVGTGDTAGSVAPASVAAAVERLVDSFYRQRADLVARNACPCDACGHIGALDIKVVVHRGGVLRYHLRGIQDLSGLAVIEAHRLLKNTVPSHRYVLVSEAAGAVQVRWNPVPHNESYDDIGEMHCLVYLPDDLPDSAPPAEPSGSRASDLAIKLVQNARSLTGADRG